MSLAALIKKGGLRSIATATPATLATDGAQTTPSVATVATVAVATAPGEAANDTPADRDAKVSPRVEATPVGHDRDADREVIGEQVDEVLGKFADPDHDQGRCADMRRKGEPKADAGQPPTADLEFSDQYARARVLLPKRAEAEAAPDGNPEAATLTKAEGDTFTDRRARFLVSGQALDDAERLAEMLVIRDRDGDDRRLCLECSYYGSSGRCVAAATGRLPGVSARLEPVATILWRCDAFGLRKGLV